MKTPAGLARVIEALIDNPAFFTKTQQLLVSGVVESFLGRDEWVAREEAEFRKLADWGLPGVDTDAIARGWQKEKITIHHRYQSKGIGMKQELEACKAAGIKMNSMSIPDGAELLPTEEGVMRCNVALFMSPFMRTPNPEHFPFNQSADAQDRWMRSWGCDGYMTGEEVLLAILRSWSEFRCIPFMGGWVRVKNSCDFGHSLAVSWSAGLGLCVRAVSRSEARWRCGAVPREFVPVGA